ncbi:MAG: hypothetical protein IKL10_01285 [Clostridia bacterium]|nr:hypothetical protein [Clostridia bacterium]
MNSENLFDSITKINDELITEADAFTFKKKKRPVLPIIASLAAAFIIVIALGFIADNMELSIFSGNHEVVTDFADTTSREETTTSVIAENTTEEAPVTNEYTNPVRVEAKPMNLVKAEYPVLAKYPLMGENPEYSDRMMGTFNEWNDDLRKLRSIDVETDNIKTFSVSLMEEFLTGDEDENKTLSPLNIYMALCLLAETVDGKSRAQILSLMGADSIGSLRTQANKIWQRNYRDDGVMKSILANSLWLDDFVKYKKSTITTLAEKYFASVYSGTMGSDSYNEMLNNWINEQTGGLLSPEIKMSPQTVLTIASTLLYNSKWNNEFSPKLTKDGIFNSPSGELNIEFMNGHTTMQYYWGDKFAAIALPLDIGGHMWFILPDEGVDADEIFSDSEVQKLISLNSTELYNYKNSKFLQVNMSVPKFDVTETKDLTEGLKNLGITDCLDAAKADFSPLATEAAGIFLDKVEHGVRVKIDEEGVSAAAYTVMMEAGAPAPPDETVDFIVNRPFAFAVTLDYDVTLFAGVVNNP